MSDARKAARCRAAAAVAIDAVQGSGKSLDAALESALAQTPESDQALLRMLCYGCLRNHWQLAAWTGRLLDRPLKKRDSVVGALMAVGLYQITSTRIPDHAAVSSTVEAARLLRRPKLAGLLNATLRRFMREQMATQPETAPEVRFNHPQWMIEKLQTDWPSDWETILRENDTRAPMWLRVNTARCSRDDYRKKLETAGLEATTAAGFEAALRLDEPVPVSELPGFEDGEVSVQEAAAQVAAEWLTGRARGRLLDACAAPGGKSVHIKELAGTDAELTCVDIDAERLDRVHENLRRSGFAATVCVGDASKPGEWWDKKPFDGILLDAPCSASGVIRRHPDIKLLRRASDFDALSRRQAGILRALWDLLRPGGSLLYVTCSVFSAENEAVVGHFLDSTADARENDTLQNNNMRAVMRRKACGFQILPGTKGLDGFYYACLEKAV